jgi:hypothetical protein
MLGTPTAYNASNGNFVTPKAPPTLFSFGKGYLKKIIRYYKMDSQRAVQIT